MEVVRTSRLVLLDPAAGVLSALDLVEHPLHLLLRLLGDEAYAARVVTELGGVGDRRAHGAEATAVDEVHDELQLVQDLAVGDLGLVAVVLLS